MSTDTWRPFGIADEEYDEASDGRGQKILNITWRRPKQGRKAVRADRGERDQSGTWLRSAVIGLGVLAAAAAAVSFAAQYQLVFDAKGVRWASVLEAGIPDVGAMVFAALGIALALKGKRALRARGGNLACVGLSLVMNLIAAAAGWRGVAIWVMPSAVYAFASDTLIGVIRAHVLASQGRADNEKTALGALGAALLWGLRLTLAAPSTLKGFRRWVVESSPVAPGVTPAAITAANESAAKAIEAAHVTAGQQIAEAAQAQDEAASRAQDAERRAGAAQQAAATAQSELQRAREDFAQLNRALQRAEDERSRLAGMAEELQTAVAGQRAEAAASARAAEAARGEAQRIREDAGRQVVQMREDFIRERAEYRDSLAGMREAAQALDKDRRQISQERDSLQTELAALRAAQRAVKSQARDTGRTPARRSRAESKTARFLALVVERYGELAAMEPAEVGRIAADLAPEVGLNEGSARSALRPRVLAARGGVS